MKLIFYGGAKSVTGANYLLESGNSKILIDCGLMQGSHFAEKTNFEPFDYDPRGISAVLVTHAHLDHVGRLPKLFTDGFRGEIFSTAPTRDFAELVLYDSEHILGKEADREHCAPFCTQESVKEVMNLWRPVKYHQKTKFGPFEIEFFDAGHILGSASIKIKCEGKTIIFSGDLGNYPAPIITPAELPAGADFCVIESCYGDRNHENSASRREMLEDVIEDTVKNGGTLMIPVFALERTQEILYHLHELFEQRRIPRTPVFVDSPLAIKMTAVYKKYEEFFNKETKAMVKSGDDILNFPGLQLSLTTEQSKDINGVKSPKIILAGSGMSQGGRILHHELRYLSDPKNTILFVGYQSAGSLGRLIMDGAGEVTIYGETVPIRCSVRSITAYSAHADRDRLFAWVSATRSTLKEIFVVQGEEKSSESFAQKVRDELAIEAEVPNRGESAVL